MTAAQLVGHLHLGNVDVLRATAVSLKRHGIQQESRVGRVVRYKPDTLLRTIGFILVVAPRLFLFRPFQQSVGLSLIVQAEIAANSLYET